MTNSESAVSVLKSARNVYEWNAIRDTIKKDLSIQELSAIDGSGLIVQVLGADNYRKYE